MSVAEIAPRNDDFERTPPHDVAAEQCVLGGDAAVQGRDLGRDRGHRGHGLTTGPAHQLVFDEVILDLYARGEPADAITVANELNQARRDRPASAARRTCTP